MSCQYDDKIKERGLDPVKLRNIAPQFMAECHPVE